MQFNYDYNPKLLLNFNNIYKIIKLLGEGEFGKIYLIKNKLTNKLYALKLLKYNNINKNLFNREVSMLIKLSKISNCNIYMSCYYNSFLIKINNQFYYGILMDYILGMSLDKFIFNNKLNRKDIINIGLELLNIVYFLHNHGYVHNDISLRNIMLFNNKIKLIDFGLSCYTKSTDNRIKCKKDRLFNLNYASPEIKNGIYKYDVNKYSKTSDIYSLGLVLYYLFDFYHIKFDKCLKNVIINMTLKNPNERATAEKAYQLLLKC